MHHGDHHYEHLHNLSQAFDFVLVLTYFISAIKKTRQGHHLEIEAKQI